LHFRSFSNLSSYNIHFIIKEIVTAYEGQAELFPITKEKYILFTKNIQSTDNNSDKNSIKLRFIDSYKFLNTILAKFVSSQ